MRIAAVIPARKNSKRIPKKNLMEFEGDHIINKVIRNLIKSNRDIEIFISTDDEDLVNLIDQKVNFLSRPESFSDDFSTVSDLIQWHFKNDLSHYDFIIQTYCHAICIPAETYEEALKKLENSKKNSLLTISKLDGPVEWTFKLIDGEIMPNFPLARNKRSQDLGISYIDSGQFYIYKKEWFLKELPDEYESNYEWIELNYYQSNDLDEEHDIVKLKNNYDFSKKMLSSLE